MREAFAEPVPQRSRWRRHFACGDRAGPSKSSSWTPEGRSPGFRGIGRGAFPYEQDGRATCSVRRPWHAEDQYFSQMPPVPDAQTPALAVVADGVHAAGSAHSLAEGPDERCPCRTWSVKRRGANPGTRGDSRKRQKLGTDPMAVVVVTVNPALLPVSVAPTLPAIRQSESTETSRSW